MLDEYMYQDSVERYVLHMRPVLNTQAIFSDGTEEYCNPTQPEAGDDVTFRIRTAKNNVDSVYLINRDGRWRMQKEKTDQYFDYYSLTQRMPESTVHYYFEIRSGRKHCFYNKLGVTEDVRDEFAFRVCPGFKTPDWAKGAVMYQIMVDRFNNGDPSNDVLDNEYCYIGAGTRHQSDWSARPDNGDIRTFYGGDLQGVLDKLDYLQDLGIEVIYFNPLFVSPSDHKYDIQDYDHIDPHFGTFAVDEGEVLAPDCKDNRQATRYISRVTRQENLDNANAMFAHVVEECHKRGIRVILDGVFNHCGSFNKWLDRELIYENQAGYEKGAYVSADSPYRSFFHFTEENSWPYNPHYDGWWGHDTLPKLNYEHSEKLEQYILHVARKWVSPPYNVDGWRLDVAADLGLTPEYNHSFWKKFRQAVKEANPEAIILAEHYGDPGSWLQGDQWDTIMNYSAFMEPMTWFFTGMEKHSDDFKESMLGNAGSFVDAMRYNMASFMWPSLAVAMNELSNHDHSRFLTRTNHKVGRFDHFDYDAASEGVNPAVMREAIVMQMTWPGAPTLYYGDEAGVCGFTDPDNRRTYPWGQEDQRMLQFYKEAIKLHKEHPVFAQGSLVFLEEGYNVLVYGRFDSNEQLVVIYNNNDTEATIQFSVLAAGIGDDKKLRSIFMTNAEGWNRQTVDFRQNGGRITVHLPKTSALVLKAIPQNDYR